MNKTTPLSDYRIAYLSRLLSLKGRKEVLGGRAKFGIFGDGKEIPQVAMAHFIKPGDWRAGYYRDQTFLLAIGETTPEQFFAQLYADTDPSKEPIGHGRQMNCHYASRFWDPEQGLSDQTKHFYVAADLSPTGGHMPKMIGLGYASKIYRQTPSLKNHDQLGQSVVFGTIGNASAAEGLFWESLNAAGVLQVPIVLSVWDDEYGISVPNAYQMTKGSVHHTWSGFGSDKPNEGFSLYQVSGHDYPALIKIYEQAVNCTRQTHKPAGIHVHSLTQPQGHSTSGSHERYKSKERLAFEDSTDGIKIMAQWLLKEGFCDQKKLQKIETSSQEEVDAAQENAWSSYQKAIKKEQDKFEACCYELKKNHTSKSKHIESIFDALKKEPSLTKRQLHVAMVSVLIDMADEPMSDARHRLREFFEQTNEKRSQEYSSYLYVKGPKSPLRVTSTKALFSEKSPRVDGRQLIQKFFEHKLSQDPRIFIIGEDVGQLGGVNLEFEGLHQTFGALRVTDTGIREATIFGQGMGAAMRGLKPIVDIQYLDYLAYCFQGLTDDLATLHYRTAGGQVAPVIVRTKGHRLEGIWHTGSPMGMIVSALRGVHVCVPRNSLQACGFYNTLLEGDDPGLVIEVLNGYRVKERLADNLSEYKLALGECETLIQGTDLTVVTYGACCHIALEAAKKLQAFDIHIEIIDVQTLLPFDLNHSIRTSIEKTHMLLVLDEDVPGGASAYMLQKILEEQKAYELLDGPPSTLTAKEHRSPYGSDGDYYAKPNKEDIFLKIYDMIKEREPHRLADLF